MRFWDASALVSLLLVERTSQAVRQLTISDPLMTVWWGTKVECSSAIFRRGRSLGDGEEAPADALRNLDLLSERWVEIPPSPPIRDGAIQLLRRHDLRAADALQLAAALQAAESRPATLPFVCLDARLGAAATAEGFTVLDG